MRRRILIAIAMVAVLAVVAMGVPLGTVVGRLYRDDEVIRLERSAAQAGQAVGATVGGRDPVELPGGTGGTSLALYSRDGRRVTGDGPRRADPVVRRALAGESADATLGGELVVAVPVAREERVVGAVRAARDGSLVAGRVRRAWALLFGLGAFAVGIAGLVAVWLSRRLARPIEDLAVAAERLGAGDFTVAPGKSGVGEVDAAGAALAATAGRLREVLERERAFSADASHQLRTPLAALRLELEAAALDSRPPTREQALTKALAQVERLERTIDTLLNLARDAAETGERASLVELLDSVEDEWRGRLAAQGRPLRTSVAQEAAVLRASAGPIGEVLRVLVENAAIHGSGAVTIRARAAGGAAAIDVSDEGRGVADPARLFARRHRSATGIGIGLALARSLAEAEGGRLYYDPSRPATTFTLLLPAPEPQSGSSR